MQYPDQRPRWREHFLWKCMFAVLAKAGTLRTKNKGSQSNCIIIIISTNHRMQASNKEHNYLHGGKLQAQLASLTDKKRNQNDNKKLDHKNFHCKDNRRGTLKAPTHYKALSCDRQTLTLPSVSLLVSWCFKPSQP